MILPAELIPSAQHDPLFEGLQRGPAGLHEVVVLASAAERLKVAKGAVLQASLSRQYQVRARPPGPPDRRCREGKAFTRPAVFASL